ncbi:hypothetical protein CXG81DRAFT_25022 [Caulochytrium protostelioides]|uniref:SH3 domain-containing protein n=1 Tax=Caulochytrium protostelioides TaxID=1555241 RepID=A0A4V1IV00_9FUNG|nr:hypothetical protein CXG81DRAFT_25022 [Caulochytrium protostelioides]|eukprot:RKP02329.1 hypothetical protein CXG81DRAFT_25022 [Caulochytrium protostelioides]
MPPSVRHGRPLLGLVVWLLLLAAPVPVAGQQPRVVASIPNPQSQRPSSQVQVQQAQQGQQGQRVNAAGGTPTRVPANALSPTAIAAATTTTAAAAAASTTPPATRCPLLAANTLCGPEYAQYPITAAYWGDSASFDAWLTENVLDAAQLSHAYVSAGCKEDKIDDEMGKLRFMTSFWCSKAVNDAITIGNCPPPTGATALPLGPVLCPSAPCPLVADSVRRVLDDTSVCPVPESGSLMARQRQQLVGTYTAVCASWTSQLSSHGSTQQCSMGSATETAFCGFRSMDAAAKGCDTKALRDDACCRRIGKAYHGGHAARTGGLVALAAVLLLLAVAALLYVQRRRARAPLSKVTAATVGVWPWRRSPRDAAVLCDPAAPTSGTRWAAWWPWRRSSRSRHGSRPSSHSSVPPRPESTYTLNALEDGVGVGSSAGSVAAADSPPQRPPQAFSSDAAWVATTAVGRVHPNAPALMPRTLPSALASPGGLSIAPSEAISVADGVPDDAMPAATPVPRPRPQPRVASMTLADLLHRRSVGAATPSNPPAICAVRILRSYASQRHDELDLEVGDTVTVLRTFSDGWAHGTLAHGGEGAFPLMCAEDHPALKPMHPPAHRMTRFNVDARNG